MISVQEPLKISCPIDSKAELALMVLDTMDSKNQPAKNSKKLSKKSVIMSPTWEETIEEMKVVSEIIHRECNRFYHIGTSFQK